MSNIQYEVIYTALHRTRALIDFNICNDIHKIHEFQKQTILADKSLTEDEKAYAIRELIKAYDRNKVLFNSGTKRVCKNCIKECLATLYCECCVQNYLKANFSNWTSRNDDIDNLIQRCQLETLLPQKVVEWIPYNNLQNIEYLTKGGFSEIYTAIWIGGRYKEWDSKEQRLKRLGDHQVILKGLGSIENANQKNAIHRDLHSGNILYSQFDQDWYISDLGFCGPADKPSTSIYGNLPYISPEVIAGKKTTKASDVYSIAMLMWEISSCQLPFNNYEHDYYLVTNIINGIRPKIVSGTPLKYKNLMKQCWDADPSKRPNINTIINVIGEIQRSYFQDIPKELSQQINDNLENKAGNNSKTNYTSSKLFTSKIHQFENLPEPRNATEEEQEAFHSKPYDFNIPDNVDDFNKSSNQNTSKASGILKVFKKLQINSNNDNQNNYEKEIEEQQQTKKYNASFNDEEEIYDDKNFHSEEQDEYEIPDDGF
ncbi:kinase-like domain-containing protein [Glomus cerebriforme]|uniref:Kinase-like domain-containing protein n=1 Tax=Glomus cerebriforme TaxID=658196 RepID=A0A397TEJ7_9GLOM|nr:kinase-like domain-containing protein [Glomus cerebriforme]